MGGLPAVIIKTSEVNREFEVQHDTYMLLSDRHKSHVWFDKRSNMRGRRSCRREYHSQVSQVILEELPIPLFSRSSMTRVRSISKLLRSKLVSLDSHVNNTVPTPG